ncbi:MAG: NSE2 family E3 SUMO-protein ligase [Chlamydiales bacterium]
MASSSSSSGPLPSPPLQFPANYLCPLTKRPMRNPVMAPCKHNFEKAAIVEWIKNNLGCPIGCDAQISSTQLTPNSTLQDDIARFAKSAIHHVRSSAKMQGVSTGGVVQWNESRIMTPGGLFAYKRRGGVTFYRSNGGENMALYTGKYEEELGSSGAIRIVVEKEESQGLFFQDGQQQAVGASVTTMIKAETDREEETVSVYVQYDKTKVILDGKDFSVNPLNYQGRTFYQGGHLIDHRFSAESSHYDARNYFPVHFYYNSPLKNYLVDRCDAYVEIPLYTSNPPMIGVLQINGRRPLSELYHPIPIGVIFVQINGGNIQDVYYFPNNDVNYKEVADRLTSGQTASERIIPYFKLKKSFQKLLRPAIITDLLSVINGEELQKAKEDIFFQVVDEITTGLTFEECFDVVGEITQLGFAVLKKTVKPSLFLEDHREDSSPFQDQPLPLAFKVLGDFLIHYGMTNALKCETLSIKTRLIFLSVIVSFISAQGELETQALDYINQFDPQYRFILKELDGIVTTMNEEELLFLANIQVQIADPFNHQFILDGYDIYNPDDLPTYFAEAVQTIRLIDEKYDVTSFSHDHRWNFVLSIECIQKTLDYIVDTGFSEECYREESRFLISLREKCIRLLDELPSRQSPRSSPFGLTFQTNVKDEALWRTSSEYLQSVFIRLGEISSHESSSSSSIPERIEQSASFTISSDHLIIPVSSIGETDSVPTPASSSFSTTERAEIESLDKSVNSEFPTSLVAAEEISSEAIVKEADL